MSEPPKPANDFAPLKREPAYLKVFEAIERRILEGGLAVGDPIPTEADLCAQFGVTRSTVREGLRLLQQTGLVERGAAKRFVVSRPDAAQVAEAASRGLALSGATFREVWDVLTLLYPQAARLAATSLDDASAETLRAVRARLAAAPEGDHDATVLGAVAFLEALADGLSNRVLRAMLGSLNLMIGESLRQVIGGAAEARARILAAQDKLIAAIAARDAAEAEAWMARHIADLKRGYDVAGVALDRRVL